jgi:hypothetical protein
MTPLKIATSLYLIQAGIGVAAGLILPWLQFFQIVGY